MTTPILLLSIVVAADPATAPVRPEDGRAQSFVFRSEFIESLEQPIRKRQEPGSSFTRNFPGGSRDALLSDQDALQGDVLFLKMKIRKSLYVEGSRTIYVWDRELYSRWLGED